MAFAANLRWLHGYSMLGSQSRAGAGKTGDVPAPERTKTEEGDDEESESDEEYVRACKMMRLSLAHGTTSMNSHALVANARLPGCGKGVPMGQIR